jgi:hypothetical protein
VGNGTPPVFFRDLGGRSEAVDRAIGRKAGGPTRPLDAWFEDLSFEESICWAFEVDEGDLEELYWRLSFYELIGRVKLKFGELSARMLCQFTAFAEVVNGIFGKADGDAEQPLVKGEYNDLADAPSFDAALAASTTR